MITRKDTVGDQYIVEWQAPAEIYLPKAACKGDAAMDFRVYLTPESDGTYSKEELLSRLGQHLVPTPEYYYINGKKTSYRDAQLQLTQERGNCWLELVPGQTLLVGTGVRWRVERFVSGKTLCLLLLPRSGLASKSGLVLANTVGLVDAGYPEEIRLALRNQSSYPHYISEGLRAAQGLLLESLSLGESGLERTSGFGHTGSS